MPPAARARSRWPIVAGADDELGPALGCRPGHPEDRGAGLVLRDRQPARAFDRVEPVGAVAAHPGEHDRHAVRAGAGRDAAQQYVRGRPMRPGMLARVEHEPAGAVERQVGTRRARPRSPARLRPAPASRTGSGTWSSSQRAKPSMKPGAMCCTTRIGIANVGRDLGENGGERLRSAGRGADPDHRGAPRRHRGCPRVRRFRPRTRVVEHADAAEQLDALAERSRGVSVGIAEVERVLRAPPRARRLRAHASAVSDPRSTSPARHEDRDRAVRS